MQIIGRIMFWSVWAIGWALVELAGLLDWAAGWAHEYCVHLNEAFGLDYELPSDEELEEEEDE